MTHDNDDAKAPTRPGPALWLTPAVLVTVIMAALASLYLGSSVNSADHLDGFPVAVVNADRGDTGAKITEGLRKNTDPHKFDLRTLTLAEAREQMGEGKLYGAIVLPADLTQRLGALSGPGTDVQRPQVTVYTNPLANTSSVSIVNAYATKALTGVNETVGKQLLAAAPKAPGIARLVLAAPLDVHTTPYEAVPSGTGNGLSAFYYALLLVLAGFTGSVIVANLVDAQLGFIPLEWGPVYRMAANSGHSRQSTLLFKWALMGGLAVVVSSAYLGIAAWLGMPLDHPWQLWLLGILVIAAVAVVAQAILALLGGLGMIISLLLFVVLAVPSSGGTTPLEALPPFIRFLSGFEPVHQAYVGVRSVLYFGATWDGGLGRAVIASTVALVLGLAAGFLGTRAYDRKGLTRSHPTETPAPESKPEPVTA
ncbi:YhgE/Pip domain-containing protein [Streptomyces acidiscabies]|uniref:YhgE/Pip domain-containing protein n=1 Tax=Streptomyces acidiscabies TaxID=42234 RepID=UPI000951A7DE|nr:ABC transporter permease [Streptomyces acidiscabies]